MLGNKGGEKNTATQTLAVSHLAMSHVVMRSARTEPGSVTDCAVRKSRSFQGDHSGAGFFRAGMGRESADKVH